MLDCRCCIDRFRSPPIADISRLPKDAGLSEPTGQFVDFLLHLEDNNGKAIPAEKQGQRATGSSWERGFMNNSRRRLKGHELFYFTSCPYCIKVRLALWWMGLKLPLKDISLHPKNKAELISGGGKKQVPCLRIEDEGDEVRWMYESSDIIRYLKRQLAS